MNNGKVGFETGVLLKHDRFIESKTFLFCFVLCIFCLNFWTLLFQFFSLSLLQCLFMGEV